MRESSSGEKDTTSLAKEKKIKRKLSTESSKPKKEKAKKTKVDSATLISKVVEGLEPGAKRRVTPYRCPREEEVRLLRTLLI